MPAIDPLFLSQQLLQHLGTHVTYHRRSPLPDHAPLLVVSNHRSIMDAPLVMAATQRVVRFACHHYMGQVPILNEIVTSLGCFPLDAPGSRQRSFFQHAVDLLGQAQVVGVFPEGARPMVEPTSARATHLFHRGFAHLALRSPLEPMMIVPVAIASQKELCNPLFPLRMLSWFDPSEPLFNQPGWHPMIFYQSVDVIVGKPIAITAAQRQAYRGRHAKAIVGELTAHCRAEVDLLLHQGY